MNPDLDRLQPYPFERLRALLDGSRPPVDRAPINLSIGEPKHPIPDFVREALVANLNRLDEYPLTRGEPALREAIAAWITRRFGLSASQIDPARHLLPVNGTREALFAIAPCVVDRTRAPLVLFPNPFYQIYEGAALLAGAEPYYVPCDEATGLARFDDVPDTIWSRTALVYVNSPGNPTGAVVDRPGFARLIERADRHGFTIASDECYSEIYADEDAPPPGLLEVAHGAGHTDFQHCLVFHSLSKRSSVPGLRSGFVAGDARLIEAFHRYRTYHGCAMAPPVQAASRAAWSDESHVRANRALYRAKFDAVLEILAPVIEVARPAGGFYLWPRTPGADTDFARRLHGEEGLTVLPGTFLGRTVDGHNPGAGRIRIALVPPLDACVEAAQRIRRCIAHCQ